MQNMAAVVKPDRRPSRVEVVSRMYNWLVYPHRIAFVRRHLPPGGCRILDIGCGNHSPKITKRYLPDCEYHGVHNARWNLDENDDRCVDRLFELDLNDSAALEQIPVGEYDAVICSHILEHLSSPMGALTKLADAVKPGGVIYVEVPSKRSLRLPRAANGWMGFRGCLNFRDDETHVEWVDPDMVARVLRDADFAVRGPCYRWMWRRVLLFPFYCVGCLFAKGFIPASVLWDVTGFAVCVTAVRNRGHLRLNTSEQLLLMWGK